MRARVLFFGLLKEIVGRAAEDAEFPPGADLRAVFECYAARFPKMQQMAASIVVARNHEFAALSTALTDGDEVAFLPPVSGGADAALEAYAPLEIEDGGHYFALTLEAIDVRSLVARVQTGAEGAVVTFEGTVRNNTKGRPTLCLDYDCYEPMALKTMAMVHRLGRMLVGEVSVAVIVAAPHRKPAFDAALEGINRLKKLVPIWKKEHFVDGEVWVEGEWDRNVPVAG
jgi:molybdopterin synthase catalytic subunit